ncbi:ubiquinol-cytochrome C chaperone family protein [Lichenihabitans sp. Uapishka_5]|uniref:ubiquinol-cytochrome C chaperone family protein n=1 Tax=Lichenihabitans sp. Uapishka_5 TaxID=3037302 RepID=UPI0029E81018|nr:ubiquinol-cytochrome C chaperone family protein [Lichenihabitans sp. Uapishka_5]MDX7950746.1 ubiquinol-cytochrome C chaperone family protein [Lichenihabitans sp. Uapishka_5]
MRLPFARSRPIRAASAAEPLHDALVAQIRQPVFYTDFGVPDTFEGRFDLLVLHAALALRRLRDLGDDGRDLAQRTVDLMFARFEIALRESGVSDIGIPKRMTRLAEAFKGRAAAYDAALAGHRPEALAEAVNRNVLGGAGDGRPLAAYAATLAAAFEGGTLEDFQQGRPAFTAPDRFARPA